MRTIFWVAAFAALIVPPSVTGQASPMVSGYIPFTFNVAGMEMPAGEYDVLSYFSDVLLVTPKDRSDGVFVQRSVDTAVQPPQRTQLVFNKYANGKYYLSQILRSGKAELSQIPKSKEEREVITTTLHAGLRSTRVVVLAHLVR